MTESANLHRTHAAPPASSARVINLGELHAMPQRATAPLLAPADTESVLGTLRVTLQVSAGKVELTVRELLSAREQEVLLLDRAIDQPVDILLEGKVVARGELVAVEGCFGIRLTQLPMPLAS